MVSLGGLLAMVIYAYIKSAILSLLVMMAIIPIFVLTIWWQNKKSNEIMKLVKNNFNWRQRLTLINELQINPIMLLTTF